MTTEANYSVADECQMNPDVEGKASVGASSWMNLITKRQFNNQRKTYKSFWTVHCVRTCQITA